MSPGGVNGVDRKHYTLRFGEDRKKVTARPSIGVVCRSARFRSAL